jgi:hypothetical protein
MPPRCCSTTSRRRRAARVRPDPAGSTACYDAFIDRMASGGVCRLLEERPVLLRLIAALTRQWLSASAGIRPRLDSDLERIRGTSLQARTEARVVRIDGVYRIATAAASRFCLSSSTTG